MRGIYSETLGGVGLWFLRWRDYLLFAEMAISAILFGLTRLFGVIGCEGGGSGDGLSRSVF